MKPFTMHSYRTRCLRIPAVLDRVLHVSNLRFEFRAQQLGRIQDLARKRHEESFQIRMRQVS
jgi:hypothetical protein